MIANSTTLVLGAGASKSIGYPIGSELRSDIITGIGIKPYLQHVAMNSESERYRFVQRRYERFLERFSGSHVASIDAFLALPENIEFEDVGTAAIAAALLPKESIQRDRDWYAPLFNAIRFRADAERQHKLQVVTFNYDLSLEYMLFHAFKGTFGCSDEDARQMFKENVEVNHVYGDLGELRELSDSQNARSYGEEHSAQGIVRAAKRIHIIGRHEATRASFEKAFATIAGARFVAILGFGFDPTNMANLRLREALAEHHPFVSGYDLGAGARARLNLSPLGTIMGSKRDGVKEFLAETDFLNWMNEPGARPASIHVGIDGVFRTGGIPYSP